MRVVDLRAAFAFFALLAAGCGGSDKPVEPELDLVPVTGVVTLNGQALADAEISFLFDGKPPEGFVASGAKTDSSGKFIVMTGSKSGTVPGRYKVTISQFRMPDGSPVKEDSDSGLDMEMLRQGGQLKQMVPDRYSNPGSTELSAAVADSDKNELEFKLSGS